MKKASVCLILIFAIALVGCNQKYDSDDFIGLTSDKIIEKYGEFDHTHNIPQKGLYRNCGCGYIVKEAKTGFLGTTPPEYFIIYFDENGVAYSCDYEEGGCGG